MNKEKLLNKIVLYVLLLIGVLLSLFPFYWMFIGGTNPSGAVFNMPPRLIPGEFLWENFTNLNESVGILRSLFNSLFIAVTFTVLAVLIASMAGYAFAKYSFKGREAIFFTLLLAMMIPYHVTLIPLFRMFAAMDWLNTYQAVILPQLSYPFAIFLMRQNMKAIPYSLLESARVDGAGELKIFFKVALPTMRPALAAVAIFLFMFQWNNFMWPLVVLNTSEMETLPVALSSLIGLSRIDYGQVMMGATISVVPVIILFLILQKQFISGILGGAVKE
ncbi:carbohydrate ABC transporter permease [Alkalicoccus chagannorensis]|uniref:carbohydrate ABC transporter permease n=1 Tax=Alkalicoccus chagannorensis TaxID=427072 RepID=UPI000414A9EC|nr:carbohydrate ABC transporter permease [Alkalicoccus chagannorensis]